jgi:hypothetical protein
MVVATRSRGELATEITLEEPRKIQPPSSRARHDFVPILEALKQHPGQFARIATWANPAGAVSARTLLSKNPDRRPSGKFVFTSRRLEDGSGALYAKFLGEEE